MAFRRSSATRRATREIRAAVATMRGCAQLCIVALYHFPDGLREATASDGMWSDVYRRPVSRIAIRSAHGQYGPTIITLSARADRVIRSSGRAFGLDSDRWL